MSITTPRRPAGSSLSWVRLPSNPCPLMRPNTRAVRPLGRRCRRVSRSCARRRCVTEPATASRADPSGLLAAAAPAAAPAASPLERMAAAGFAPQSAAAGYARPAAPVQQAAPMQVEAPPPPPPPANKKMPNFIPSTHFAGACCGISCAVLCLVLGGALGGVRRRWRWRAAVGGGRGGRRRWHWHAGALSERSARMRRRAPWLRFQDGASRPGLLQVHPTTCVGPARARANSVVWVHCTEKTRVWHAGWRHSRRALLRRGNSSARTPPSLRVPALPTVLCATAEARPAERPRPREHSAAQVLIAAPRRAAPQRGTLSCGCAGCTQTPRRRR